ASQLYPSLFLPSPPPLPNLPPRHLHPRNPRYRLPSPTNPILHPLASPPQHHQLPPPPPTPPHAPPRRPPPPPPPPHPRPLPAPTTTTTPGRAAPFSRKPTPTFVRSARPSYPPRHKPARPGWRVSRAASSRDSESGAG